MTRPEPCPNCSREAIREFYPRKWYFHGEKINDAEFYASLGTVVKNKRHRKYLMESQGLIEVGNCSTDTLHKEAEKTLEHNQNKAWEKIDAE